MKDASKKNFGLPEWLVLTGYVALLAFAAPHHVFWGDEAQAWLLARDSSLADIVLHRLHYEGTPGLWHALLWLLTRLHMPFTGLHCVAAIVATAGVVIWLRYAPVHRWLKWTLPFTFFMAFQYAIVARSYVFYPLLVFTACALLGSRDEAAAGKRTRPVVLAGVLALLANLCMFGTAIAAAFGLVAATRAYRNGSWKTMKRQWVAATLILCAAGAFAVSTAWPAKDIGFTTGIMDLPQVKKALHRTEPVAVQQNAAEDADVAPVAAKPEPAKHTFLKQRLLFSGSLMVFPIATSTVLALLTILLLLYRCVSQGAWVEMLPYIFVLFASIAVYAAEHHTGLLLVALVSVVWLSWPAELAPRGITHWMELGLRASLLLVFLLQIGWTLHAIHSERHVAYAGDRGAAEFLLQQHAQGKKIAGYYAMSDGVEPYFAQNIYANQPSSFWRYSANPNVALLSNTKTLAIHPDYVVLGTVEDQQQMILNQLRQTIDPAANEPGDIDHVGEFFGRHGYHETHRFCGLAPIRSGYSLRLCQVILEPAS